MTDIVFRATPGLANRLRAMAGYIALAKLRGTRVVVQWVLNDACGSPFDQLFAPMQGWDFEVISSTREGLPAVGSQDVHTDAGWFHDIWSRAGRDTCDETTFARLAVKWLRELQPHDRLRPTIDSAASELQTSGCVGVHLRMTDNLNNYAGWIAEGFDPEKASLLEGFEQLIRGAADRRQRVFLATDNLEIERRLTDAFANVCCVPKNYSMSDYSKHASLQTFDGRTRLSTRVSNKVSKLLGIPPTDPVLTLGATQGRRTTSIEEAVVDFFLLGTCQEVVTTYWSSFGEVAAVVGRRPCTSMLGRRVATHADVMKWNAVDG